MREFDNDELSDLNDLIEKTNDIVEIKLEESEIKAAHSMLKKDFVFYITSNIRFHTLKTPRSCYINLKIDSKNDNIIETMEKLLRCVAPPYRIFVDFFCLSKSATHPEPLLIHPSISTCFNKQKLIVKKSHKEILLQEFAQGQRSAQKFRLKLRRDENGPELPVSRISDSSYKVKNLVSIIFFKYIP